MRIALAAFECFLGFSLLAGPRAWAEGSSAPGGMPPTGGQMDCDQLASMPNAPMSVETCKQMMGAMQPRNPGGASSAARRGDEAMTCEQIAAEMKTLQGVGLSEQQQKENTAAAAEHQAVMAKQQAQITAFGVEATAAVNAAAAADLATEVATGGLVGGRSAATVGEAYQARAQVMGEQMAAERKPAEERLQGAVSASTQTMAQSMQSNPRFSRLIQLAIAKDCKE